MQMQLPVQPPNLRIILWRGGVPFSAECVLCLRFFSLHSTHGMSVENARDVLQANLRNILVLVRTQKRQLHPRMR